MKNSYVLFFVTIGFLILSLCVLTSRHEEAHKQIGTYFGCNNYTIKYGVTSMYVCYNYSERTLDEYITEQTLHGWNEIFGYSLDTIFFLVWGFYALKLMRKGMDK